MSIRLILIFLACLFWTTAQAAQGGGGPSGASSYSCDGSVCTCDGGYQDCKSMEKECIDGKILCGGKCQCAMKVPARTKPGKAAPKANTPAGASPQKMQ